MRRRYGKAFDRVERFCLFVGYPRSGHSLVGALLNAHRNAVISHELNAHELVLADCTRDELYARILARAAWFNLRGNRGTYPYQVPGQWQGRTSTLQVIGDKRGGLLTRAIAKHPELLPRIRALVGVPLRLVHVVRNPFDNISAISTWNKLSLAESIEFYFFHCKTTVRLGELCDAAEVVMLRHEDMVRDPRAVLARACDFLGLPLYDRYLEDCCSIVFAEPTYTRRKIEWPAAAIRDVEKRAGAIPFLQNYEFAVRDETPSTGTSHHA